MASLLIVRRGTDIIGHCDAICYDAEHDDCVCHGCLGANHGIGYEAALVNTRAMHAVWLTAHRAVDPAVEFELDESVQHLPLFPLPQGDLMAMPRDTSQLPTFAQIRRDAYQELGDVEDGLRSDWAPGKGPTTRQAEAMAEARRHIAAAKRALDKAARL